MSVREAVHPHLHMVGEWSLTPARHSTDAAATAPGINIIWPLDIDPTNKRPQWEGNVRQSSGADRKAVSHCP